MARLPDGWTDDMNIAVGDGHSLEELVDYVLQSTVHGQTKAAMVEHLSEAFRLSPVDAELALDRAYGGVVRAATGQAANRPNKDKDPVAWISFQRCSKQPELIAAIYPQFAQPPRRPWWRRWLS